MLLACVHVWACLPACLYVSVLEEERFVHVKCRCLQSPEVSDPLEVGVISTRDLPDMGAGKSSARAAGILSYSHLSSLSPGIFCHHYRSLI